MRVNREQLAKILLGTSAKDRPRVLRWIFSFKENIDTFAYYFFPHAIQTDYETWHLEMFNKFFDPTDYAEANPRGHGKTTNIGLVYNSFLVVNKMEDYIVYIGENHNKTVQFIEPIRQEFKYNERLKEVYGDLTPAVGKDEMGRDREDCIDVNGIRIEATSFEKNMRGFKYGVKRPTLILLDDIENDERVINPDLRAKDARKLNNVIIPALDPIKGKMKMIGTILHHASLLMTKIKQYGGVIRKAIKEDGTPLMPKLWTMERLEAKKKSIGSVAFQQEFLNNPIDSTTSIIKPEWIRACFDENLSYEEAEGLSQNKKYLGIDFAFSDRVTADNTAFVGIKKGLKTIVFLLEWHKGWSSLEQFNYVRDVLHEKHKFTMVGAEENSIKSISKDLSDFKLPLRLFWTGSADAVTSDTPEFTKKRHTIGKMSMIVRLSVMFENKEIVLPYKNQEDKEKTNRLFDELISFSLSDGKIVELGIHPDLPIALAYAIEASKITGVIIDL